MSDTGMETVLVNPKPVFSSVLGSQAQRRRLKSGCLADLTSTICLPQVKLIFLNRTPYSLNNSG